MRENEQKAVSLFAWTSLPLSTRISEKLAEILVLGEALRADLDADDAASVQWLAPELERILEDARATLRRYAS